MSSTAFVNGSTLSDAGWANDVDTFSYQQLTSVSGTNTIVGTGPVSMTAYAVGQEFSFIPANTNSGATTVNITPSGATALGAKNLFWNGAACVGGEVKVGIPVKISYDGTQFNLLASAGAPFLSPITNVLSGAVSLNNTANFFDGPSIAQGTVGKWLVIGTVSLYDTAGAAEFVMKLWDGTTILATADITTIAANKSLSVTLVGFISAPAGNLRISVKDTTATTGVIANSNSGLGYDSTITAIRIG